MRSLFPERRTLPSTTAVTFSLAPISRRSCLPPLKRKAERRQATRNPLTWASAVMTSSAIPSHRYSWSFSGLMSANGSTATAGPCSTSGRRLSPEPDVRSCRSPRRSISRSLAVW